MLGIGAITYNENQNNVKRLNDEDAKLKTLIDNLTTRVATVETTANGAATSSSLSSLSTKVTSACSNLAAIAAVGVDAGSSATAVNGIRTAATSVAGC